MNVLHDLWCGRIAPQTDSRPSTPEFDRLTQRVLQHRSELRAALTEEGRQLFEALDAEQAELIALAEESIFSYALKLGMRLALEARREDTADGR